MYLRGLPEYVCCVCAWCLQRPDEVISSPETGAIDMVVGGSMGSRNQTQVLWKNSRVLGSISPTQPTDFSVFLLFCLFVCFTRNGHSYLFV